MNQQLFGTDGIRARVGQSPLTLHELSKLGYAIGQWLITKYGNKPYIFLAHDTRKSCHFIKTALESGLLLHPITICDACALPTPAVCQFVTEDNQLNAGIIITASHNLACDNGIKIINSDGIKINNEDTKIIESYFYTDTPTVVNNETLGSLEQNPIADMEYIDTICSYFEEGLLEGKTIVLDCAYGSTALCAPLIFEELGAKVIPLHIAPDGFNINKKCGSTDTTVLEQTMKNQQADIGFAFDGDGDRLIIINKNGLKQDGDDILALLTQHPQYRKETKIVGTVLSNEGFNSWLKTQNKQLIRTNVGEKYVAEELLKHKTTLGGETSGHIVLSDYLPCSDAIFTALRICEVIIETQNWNLKTFNRYPQINLTVPVNHKSPLDQQPLAELIEDAKQQLPQGRLIVRYSGTEPLLRITTEDKDKDLAEYIAQKLAEQIQCKLNIKGKTKCLNGSKRKSNNL